MAAIDDGILLMEKLCEELADAPTQSGQKPREIRKGLQSELPILGRKN
jgi:hypothetical protein